MLKLWSLALHFQTLGIGQPCLKEAFPSNIGRTKGYEDPDVNLQLLEMAAVAAAKVQKDINFP